MNNKLFILCGVDGKASTRTIYSKMVTPNASLVSRYVGQKGDFLRVYNESKIDAYTKMPFNALDVNGAKVIRWGTRIQCYDDQNSLMYNPAACIKNASNKKISRNLFCDFDVNTPKLYMDIHYHRPNKFPVIARPEQHCKGRDFVVLNDMAEFSEHYKENAELGWYYSEYIDKDREFRVYAAHGKVLGVNEKPRPENKDELAWNQSINHQPWNLLKWSDYPHDVVMQACKAVQALGLDFAGVDVVLKDNVAYVLEANTAPTIGDSPHIAEKFSKYFDWLGRYAGRREQWNFREYQKPESFAWKDSHFNS